MPNRFTIIKEQNYENYIYSNQPVRVEVARILVDNFTNQKLAQVKFINISNEVIDNITFDIVGYEVTAQQLFAINDICLASLQVAPDMAFGGDGSIALNDPRVDNIEVRIKRVVFTSGKEWSNDNNANGKLCEEMPEPIIFDGDLGVELRDALTRDNYWTNCQYKDSGKYWRCSCTHLNNDDSDHCYFCGAKKEALEQCFSKDYLTDKKYERAINLLESKRIGDVEYAKRLFASLDGWKDSESYITKCDEKKEEILKEKEEQRKKNKKRIRIAAITMVAIIVAIIVTLIIMVAVSKSRAKSYREEGKYAKALETLEDAVIQTDGVKDLTKEILVEGLVKDKDTLKYAKKHRSKSMNDTLYEAALKLVGQGKYRQAYDCLYLITGRESFDYREALEKKHKIQVGLYNVKEYNSENDPEYYYKDWLKNLSFYYGYLEKNYKDMLRIARYTNNDEDIFLASVRVENWSFERMLVELPLDEVVRWQFKDILDYYKNKKQINYYEKDEGFVVTKNNCFNSGYSAEIDFAAKPESTDEIHCVRVNGKYSKKGFDSIKRAYGVTNDDIKIITNKDEYFYKYKADKDKSYHKSYGWQKGNLYINYVRSYYKRKGKRKTLNDCLYINNGFENSQDTNDDDEEDWWERYNVKQEEDY